ncbi:MAG: DUF1488 domain-containing protein [Gammaproteobacteria bacterium]
MTNEPKASERNSRSGTEHGALSFPNPSRSYDETGHGVRFWGYDQAIEVSFFVEASALSKIDSETKPDEVAILKSFDVNRDRIREAASTTYSRRRKAAHLFSFTLKDSDF